MQKTKQYEAFLSHRQTDTGDRVAAFHEELFQRFQLITWFDQKQEDLTEPVMKNGVASSKFFILFLSPSYFHSNYCQVELTAALEQDKQIIILYEPLQDYELVYIEDIDKVLCSFYRDSKCLQFENEKEFLARFRTRLVFGKRIGSEKRERMFQDLLQIFQKEYQPPNRVLDIHNAQILLIAHPVTGEDQSELISIELNRLGIQSYFVDQANLQKNFNKIFSKNAFGALVVFLTSGVLL